MILNKALTKVIQISSTRCFSSALYITGDKAHHNFSVLTPHIDIEERFNNLEALENNLKARNIPNKLKAIEKRWTFYIHLLDRKHVLGFTRSEVAKEISKLLVDEVKNKDELDKLKVQAKLIKDEYSTLKTYLYGVEESAALNALSLPNVLHPKTPIGTENVIYTHLEKPTHNSKLHLEIGTEKGFLEYTNNSYVFLVNEGALYEYALVNYFQNKLLDQKYIQFSNADFSKSVIVEGCGSNHLTNNCVITLDDENKHTVNRLHLTGGASHYAFMAYFTRYLGLENSFPLKYFASGRKYEPIIKSDPSLLNLIQQSAIELFWATKDDRTELDLALDQITQNVLDIYKPLNYHFRLVLLPAYKIKNYESLRLSIQMYSNFMHEYVEVGNISVCDNYLSKRLLFTYNNEEKERKFPKIITGNLLNVQKVLACQLENDKENELLCDLLKQYAPL